MSTRALSPGTVVHRRYRVERVLGEGGFGVTYMVTDMRENRISAMKEYFPLEIADRRPGSMVVVPRHDKQDIYNQFKKSFLQEAQTIYNYSGHPNIISVYHLFDNENGTAYYVMEYINGVDLGKFLTQNGQRVDWETLKPIVAQIVSALMKVHASGVIHCDISPDNIFILDNGQAKLIDFGAAKNVANKSTIMLLKRGFAPPEQMSANGKLGPWTDIYALAVTVYRAITGQMPPDSQERTSSDETRWPSEMGLPIPGAYWEQALRRGMALRVEDRFQSAADFWMALSGGYTLPHSQPYTREYSQAYQGATQGYSQTQPNYQQQYQQQQYQQQQYQQQYQQQQYQQQQYQQQYAQQQRYQQYQQQQQQYQQQNQYQQQQYQSRFLPVLECVRGSYAGAKIPLSGELMMGTDRSRCNVPFPHQTPGISRVHLRLWAESGRVLAVDMGSSYGTWLGKQRMTPGKIYALPYGAMFVMGENQIFRAIPPQAEETVKAYR